MVLGTHHTSELINKVFDENVFALGHVCQGGPGSDSLTVCGMCGMLFETSFPLGAHLL